MNRILRVIGLLIVIAIAAVGAAAGYQLAGIVCAVCLAALLNRRHG